jgi:hypothetical protein
MPVDVRDVIVQGSELWVTRFKSAEVLLVNGHGAIQSSLVLPDATGDLSQPLPDPDGFSGGFTTRSVTLAPEVAWRAAPLTQGGAVIVHQEAVKDEIELVEPTVSGSAYGGGSSGPECGGIVKNAVAVLGPGGTVVSRRRFTGAPLPVDVAVSPGGQWLAIAHAGLVDPGAPQPSVVFPDDESAMVGSRPATLALGGVSLLPHNGFLAGATFCEVAEASAITQPVVAVAFAPDGRLVAQTREPSLLIVNEPPFGEAHTVPLPGDSRLDTGHEIFHRDSGGGIACASCHPEGAEDGHIWRFLGVGERRTQALHVGLAGTAPFHWDGDLEDIGRLMTEVSDAAAGRGAGLFHAAEVGCASCHSGERFTNNRTVDVGTVAAGAALQVPSLVAVGYRAPFMHDGCAATLAARFDPACGGSAHGTTQQLSAAQVADLVAYLESL